MTSIVYKYVNWNDNAKKTLTERQMYFVPANKWKKFGEFDFKLPVSDPEKLKKYIETEIWKIRRLNSKLYWKWINLNLHKFFPTEYNRLSNLSYLEKELHEVTLVQWIVDAKVKPIQENPKHYEEEMRKWYFKHTGIFSASVEKNRHSYGDGKVE